MNRETFLSSLQYFDKNFNAITSEDNDFATRFDSNPDIKTVRLSQFYNRIDVARVRQITQTNGNCFERFYKSDELDKIDKGRSGWVYNRYEEWLNSFFRELSKTELGLLYIDDYADHFRDNQSRNRNEALQKKIDSILEYAEAVDTSKKTIEEIQGLRNALDVQHLTKHKLFENLLFWVAVLLNGVRNSHVVASTTNAIIKDYFGIEGITFSRYAKIENYLRYTYRYYDAKGITIYHA